MDLTYSLKGGGSTSGKPVRSGSKQRARRPRIDNYDFALN